MDIYIPWISWYVSVYWLGYLSFSYWFIGALYPLDGISFSVICFCYVPCSFTYVFFSLFLKYRFVFGNSLRHRSCKISTKSPRVPFTQVPSVSYLTAVCRQNQEVDAVAIPLSKLWALLGFHQFPHALAVMCMVLENVIRRVDLSSHHQIRKQSRSIASEKIPSCSFAVTASLSPGSWQPPLGLQHRNFVSYTLWTHRLCNTLRIFKL